MGQRPLDHADGAAARATLSSKLAASIRRIRPSLQGIRELKRPSDRRSSQVAHRRLDRAKHKRLRTARGARSAGAQLAAVERAIADAEPRRATAARPHRRPPWLRLTGARQSGAASADCRSERRSSSSPTFRQRISEGKLIDRRARSAKMWYREPAIAGPESSRRVEELSRAPTRLLDVAQLM